MTQGDIPAPTPADDVIDRQERVEYVIDERVATDNEADDLKYALRGDDVVASPATQTGSYVQADAQSLKTAIDGIITALVASGILAEAP